MYFLLGRLLSGRLGAAIMILSPVAALADTLENWGMFRAMVSPATDVLAASVSTPSMVKWALLAIIWIFLFRLFTSKDGVTGWRVAEFATGLLYVIGGLMCLSAIFGKQDRIEQSVSLIGLASALQLAILLFDHSFWEPNRLRARFAKSRTGEET
jgi:hypothetical protein